MCSLVSFEIYSYDNSVVRQDSADKIQFLRSEQEKDKLDDNCTEQKAVSLAAFLITFGYQIRA